MKAAGGTGRSNPEPQTRQTIAVIALCIALLASLGIWNAVQPRANSSDDAKSAPISVYTFVHTGIVYVDPGTAEIVWKNIEGDRRSIGERPWRNRGAVRASESTGAPAWREGRDIVGNPDHNVVSWVETVDGRRGDLVVVDASSGSVLARTPLQVPRGHFVVLGSVDDETVYFATPDPTTGLPDVPGDLIWIWHWAGEGTPARGWSGQYYNDVSAGTWAAYGRRGIAFEDEDHRSLATVPFSEKNRTDFGDALSPDGKYWYGIGTSQIYDTTTGTSVHIPAGGQRDYRWTGATELTLTNPLTVCSAVTGRCLGPTGLSADWAACAPYDIDCGSSLPVN